MQRYRKSLIGFMAGAMALAIGFVSVPAAGSGVTLYSSVPTVLPGNVASLGYEATATSEFGDRVTFVPGSGGLVRSVTVVLSSWGCETGGWVAGCVTTPGATFSHSLTLNIYAAGVGLNHGLLLGSKTQTFAIPYRPSADPGNCPATPTKWYSAADATCYNGFATKVTFEFASPGLSAPSTVVWGVAYNTTHYGASPIGEGAACYSSSGGCGYDSLNVGAQTLALVGTDVDPDGAFVNSSWAGFYCDGGSGGVGTFRLDDAPGCWTDNRPMAEFTGPTGDDCKKDGWKLFTAPTFKNQGACVSYFAKQK